MNKMPATWEPANPDSNVLIGERTREIYKRLVSGNSESRKKFLHGTRPVHKEIYTGLTPAGFELYAGTYRGELGTPLANKTAAADSMLFTRKIAFCEPAQVRAAMEALNEEVIFCLTSEEIQSLEKPEKVKSCVNFISAVRRHSPISKRQWTYPKVIYKLLD